MPSLLPLKWDAGSPRWADLGAGLCVAGLLLPEAVAYAGLARLPVEHALVAILVGLALYALSGGSRFAIVAPTSSAATLAAAATLSLPDVASSADRAAYTQALLALVLLSGGVLVILSWARQGQLAAFVSRPVLRSFAFALAITIVIRQLPDALGLAMPHDAGSDPFHLLAFAALHPTQWHLPSVAVAAAAAVVLAVLRRSRVLPASMLVVALAIALSVALHLPSHGVAAVGTITPPALQLVVPHLSLPDWMRAGELGFGLMISCSTIDL